MSSNSIRISEALFAQARQAGDLLSRSAAQQVEHWARIGAALERAGLTVNDFMALMARTGHVVGAEQAVSESELWAHKRRAQQKDIDNVDAGLVEPHRMSWFSEGQARKARVLDAPY